MACPDRRRTALGIGRLGHNEHKPEPQKSLLGLGRRVDHRTGGTEWNIAWLTPALFIIIASSTVAIPVLYYVFAGENAEKTLTGWKAWLTSNSNPYLLCSFWFLASNYCSRLWVDCAFEQKSDHDLSLVAALVHGWRPGWAMKVKRDKRGIHFDWNGRRYGRGLYLPALCSNSDFRTCANKESSYVAGFIPALADRCGICVESQSAAVRRRRWRHGWVDCLCTSACGNFRQQSTYDHSSRFSHIWRHA